MILESGMTPIVGTLPPTTPVVGLHSGAFEVGIIMFGEPSCISTLSPEIINDAEATFS